MNPRAQYPRGAHAPPRVPTGALAGRNRAAVCPDVAAGVPPAVEPGVSPGGPKHHNAIALDSSDNRSGRQDAALYGRRDASRYINHLTE